ncbi:hypothetical protein [Haloarchaeobius sp. DFWS5]|uniref:hypothetical protein n=1 Tax=Haloarchaeobius sp. DFWS5 TaxID=3446114 RepID=UPI003EBF6DCC
MTAPTELVMAGSGVVTALSGLGVVAYVRAARQDAKTAVTVLLGATDEREGLVHEVERNTKFRRQFPASSGLRVEHEESDY